MTTNQGAATIVPVWCIGSSGQPPTQKETQTEPNNTCFQSAGGGAGVTSEEDDVMLSHRGGLTLLGAAGELSEGVEMKITPFHLIRACPGNTETIEDERTIHDQSLRLFLVLDGIWEKCDDNRA